jgi:hypothetical protein
MKLAARFSILSSFVLLSVSGCGGDDTPAPGGGSTAGTSMSFFVTSATNPNGNLGGLAGADKRCQDLAAAAGFGNKKWAAYLSAERGGAGDGPVHAKDRIGQGPWFNAKGAMVAANLAELHGRRGEAETFVDERGGKVNGQWAMSPTPNQHDILTGSNADGTVFVGRTCADWTSVAAELRAQVGHSDGLGPMMATDGTRPSWNSAHENGGCNDTLPRGGAGRFYCFASN